MAIREPFFLGRKVGQFEEIITSRPGHYYLQKGRGERK